METVPTKWVRLSSFTNRVAAETARSALSGSGIHSIVLGDDGGAQGLPVSLEHQGMEVHVDESDWPAAREALGMPSELEETPPSFQRSTLLVMACLAVVFAVAVALNVTT